MRTLLQSSRAVVRAATGVLERPRAAGTASGIRVSTFAGAHTIAAALVMAAGLALRLRGVDYGLPFVFHPDENRQILDALGMAQRLSPLPQDYTYPALHKYVLVIANGAYFAAGRLLGRFAGTEDFAVKFLTGDAQVFLVSRLASVAAGLATGVVVYRMCARLFSPTAALIGLVYSLGMFHLVQHSQWAIGDIFLALFSTGALYRTALAAEETEDTSHVTWALLFTGLAIATKPQGVFLLVPFAVSQVYALKDAPRGRRGMVFLAARLPGVALLLAASVAGNLAWIFNFHESLDKFTMLSQVAHLGISSREPFTPGLLSLTWWFAKDLVRQEGPLGAVLLAGVAACMVRRTRKDIVFLSYLFVFFFALRGWAIRYLHLFVAIMPVLCAFGARFTGEALAMLRARPAVAAALVMAVVLPSVAWSLEASALKSGTDTRLLARAWIEEHVPPGSPIAMDWYEFAVPLWSSTPVNLLNPRAAAVYESSVPQGVKRGFERAASSKKRYPMVPVVYTTERPRWPKGMPPEAVEEAGRREVYRELYSVFNFRTLDELKDLGADYLVITSYGYTNFLLDDDPEKTDEAVFNYLFREDLLSFNRQSDVYIDDGRFGLLFHLVKRAREFYEPLLHGGAGALPVAVFRPGPGRPGPVIRIFRLQGRVV